MIRISKDIKNSNPKEIFEEVDRVLEKRQATQERYLRGITSSSSAASASASSTAVQVFFEKFITDLAAGYLSGEITYNTEIIDESEEPAYRILHPSHQSPLDPDTAAQLKFIITSLSAKNDDKRNLKALFHDAVLFGAAYERQLDVSSSIASSSQMEKGSSSDPNYTYYALSALNTVALFSTDLQDMSQQVPVALITRYTLDARNADDEKEHTLYYCIECNPYTGTYQTSVYDQSAPDAPASQYDKVITLKEETPSSHKIPTFSAYEPDPQVSIIDPIISLVTAYENIMNNLNNLYQYNDTDAKLKISGYRPENPLTIPNPDFDPAQPVSTSNPDSIINPARELEDNYLINSKTFFVQEGGDVSWLLKEIHAEDATKYLKYYVDSIFQISGIPNTNDSAFNSGDLNASAIDRKFYTMALMLDDTRQGVATLIKHRWANFLARINLVNNTYYNIDDISISIGTNLPSMTDENINQQLALNGIISQKTLLSNLGYDYATEKKNKELEIPYNNAATAPDTNYVSPNDADSTTSAPASASPAVVQPEIKDQTDNIPNIQPREGRPNK